MAADDDEPRRPDPAGSAAGAAAGAAARSMTHLAQQMREMAERMLSGSLPGWPGGLGSSGSDEAGAAVSGGDAADAPPRPAGLRLPGLPAIPGMPPIPGLPTTPATFSARQLQAVVDDIAARRSQVQALIANLTTFDEQLGTLETSLRPLLQWLRTWSELEGAVTDFLTPRRPSGS
jgi:hypothetical protein